MGWVELLLLTMDHPRTTWKCVATTNTHSPNKQRIQWWNFVEPGYWRRRVTHTFRVFVYVQASKIKARLHHCSPREASADGNIPARDRLYQLIKRKGEKEGNTAIAASCQLHSQLPRIQPTIQAWMNFNSTLSVRLHLPRQSHSRMEASPLLVPFWLACAIALSCFQEGFALLLVWIQWILCKTGDSLPAKLPGDWLTIRNLPQAPAYLTLWVGCKTGLPMRTFATKCNGASWPYPVSVYPPWQWMESTTSTFGWSHSRILKGWKTNGKSDLVEQTFSAQTCWVFHSLLWPLESAIQVKWRQT